MTWGRGCFNRHPLARLGCCWEALKSHALSDTLLLVSGALLMLVCGGRPSWVPGGRGELVLWLVFYSFVVNTGENKGLLPPRAFLEWVAGCFPTHHRSRFWGSGSISVRSPACWTHHLQTSPGYHARSH